MNEVTSLITQDQTILLWASILMMVAVAIYLEQRYSWASHVSSTILVIIFGFILSNLKIIPHSSGVYSGISGVILVCSIPLLLFKANVKEIMKNSGKLFLLFHIAAVGTMIGALVCYVIYGRFDNIEYLLTILAAGEIGGTVNCLAMTTIFDTPEVLLQSIVVVGNMCVAVLMIVLRFLGQTNLVRSRMKHPHIDELESSVDLEALEKSGTTLSAKFWGGKEIGIKDIAMALGMTFTIVGVSKLIAGGVVSMNPPEIVKQLFGSVYLVMTIITVLIATIFPKFLGNIRGTMELGNIGMLMWFCTIGIAGDIVNIIKYGLLSMAVWLTIAFVNLIISSIGAKLIKGSWEDAACVTMASAGGPPTVAAMAVSFGWHKMVVPGLLVGLWGYVIGNYFGIIVGNIFGLASVL